MDWGAGSDSEWDHRTNLDKLSFLNTGDSARDSESDLEDRRGRTSSPEASRAVAKLQPLQQLAKLTYSPTRTHSINPKPLNASILATTADNNIPTADATTITTQHQNSNANATPAAQPDSNAANALNAIPSTQTPHPTEETQTHTDASAAQTTQDDKTSNPRPDQIPTSKSKLNPNSDTSQSQSTATPSNQNNRTKQKRRHRSSPDDIRHEKVMLTDVADSDYETPKSRSSKRQSEKPS